MAIKKNQAGIMAAINAAANAPVSNSGPGSRAERTLPKGTIGSVRANLGGIQEIDTDKILPWGPPDRLTGELTAVNSGELAEDIADLAASIEMSGQQIPVLLRPAKSRDGYFEVIYGRRRIKACRHIGIPVRALIRTLDDGEALRVKGLENSSRVDLSFYERARFATAIIAQGYERPKACEALAISKNTLSQLERITKNVPDSVGNAVGPAPTSGRPKWQALAHLFEKGTLNEEQALNILKKSAADLASDDRLLFLLKKTSSKPPALSKTTVDLEGIGTMTITDSAVRLNVAKDHQGSFNSFFKAEMSGLLERYRDSLKEKGQ